MMFLFYEEPLTELERYELENKIVDEHEEIDLSFIEEEMQYFTALPLSEPMLNCSIA
jgi:hypothetical protein